MDRHILGQCFSNLPSHWNHLRTFKKYQCLCPIPTDCFNPSGMWPGSRSVNAGLQDSTRPTPHTHSCEGTLGGARDAGELCSSLCKALFSIKNEGFHLMVVTWMGASLWVREVHHIWEASRIKPEAHVREAQLQLAWRKGETYWKDTGDLDTRTRAEPKISVTALISLLRNQKPLAHSLPPLLLPFTHLWFFKPESLLPSGFYT